MCHCKKEKRKEADFHRYRRKQVRLKEVHENDSKRTNYHYKHIRIMKELSSILTATSSALFATGDENSAMGLKALANIHINSEGTAALTEVCLIIIRFSH